MIAQEAETSVISQMLAEPKVISEVVGTLLQGEHFEDPGYRVIYDTVVEQHFADEGTDPLTIAALTHDRLRRLWGLSESQVVDRVRDLAAALGDGRAAGHAEIVQRGSKLRRLSALSTKIDRAIKDGEDPDRIAGLIGEEALRVVTDGSDVNRRLVTFPEVGEQFRRYATEAMKAHRAGRAIGARTGIAGIDGMTQGILPTELMMSAGEPGVGKSIMWWVAARNFAMEMMKQDNRIGTLICNWEMGEDPSNLRTAQMISGVDTSKLRGGSMTTDELQRVMQSFGQRDRMKLIFNNAKSPKASEVRAIVSEAIRKFNVGFVVIDHFKLFRMDNPPRHEIEHDEQKALFLKERIAKDLNVAVVCLAHTRKFAAGEKPTMADLRGSGQISAYADFVTFLHRPALHATEDEIERGVVKVTEAEVIWGKNRHNAPGNSAVHFDPANMSVF